MTRRPTPRTSDGSRRIARRDRAGVVVGRSRTAFSLLEVLLVLGILVIVAAVTYPSVASSLDNNRLRYSGDQVRAAWARAKNKSMESGRTYVFKCQPGGNSYVVEPWSNQDDLLETNLVTQGGVAVGESSEELAAVQLGPQPILLPEGVSFLQSQSEGDVRSQLLSATATSATATETETAWSPPIFFYPDGTCSTAQVVLGNQRERYVLVTLRGMTGVVKTHGLLTADELPR